MPVVIVLGNTDTGGEETGIATTTVADIVACAQQNLKHTLKASGADNILIAYTNDIHQQILRRRRWQWAESRPQKFITERGQPDYWIGPASTSPDGAVDTGLHLTDVQNVQIGSVRNLTGGYDLYHEETLPILVGAQNPDGTYDEQQPLSYINTRTRPYLLRLAPAPDLGSDYAIVPPAPYSTTATGGALAARTYYLRTTFVDAAGDEGLPSTTATQYIAASKKITVKTPVAPIGAGSAGTTYTSYRVYASTTEGSETLQATTTLGTDWTESSGGLSTTGASVPTSAEIDPLNGYLIEFTYYKKHANLTALTDILLTPDEYADVVCAGVTWLGMQWLGEAGGWERVEFWRNVYENGVRRMTQNENPWPGGDMFIHPDATAGQITWL